MRRNPLIAVALALFWSLAGCASPQSVVRLSTAPVAPKAVKKPFPIPIVELRGSGRQIGEEHGAKLANSIQYLHDKYLLVYLKNQTQRFLAIAAARIFESELLPEHQAEIQALAKASGVDEQETMVAQCFLDLSKMAACSTITLPASAAPDHVARFGRNLDFWSLNVADKYTTLFIIHPDAGRYAFASVGWPGMIGVLSGMNEHGLALANMEVTRARAFHRRCRTRFSTARSWRNAERWMKP